jgi:hypothetical protein
LFEPPLQFPLAHCELIVHAVPLSRPHLFAGFAAQLPLAQSAFVAQLPWLSTPHLFMGLAAQLLVAQSLITAQFSPFFRLQLPIPAQAHFAPQPPWVSSQTLLSCESMGSAVHVPMLPARLHAEQLMPQAELQQTPSAQVWPATQSLVMLQVSLFAHRVGQCAALPPQSMSLSVPSFDMSLQLAVIIPQPSGWGGPQVNPRLLQVSETQPHMLFMHVSFG